MNKVPDYPTVRSHLLAKLHARQIAQLIGTCIIAWSIGHVSQWLVHAQAVEGPWTTPVNISRSGSTSQPVIAAAPNGRLHVLWWDSIEGEQYAQTTAVTGTTWSKPTTVPQIVGDRTLITNTRTGKVNVSLSPPLEVRLVSDVGNNVYAFWRDVENQLLTSPSLGAGWGYATVLADSALDMDVETDVKGTVHLVYVRALNSPGNPSGVYYRSTVGGIGWSLPVLVYASSYFRSAKPEQLHTSVAGDGRGQVLVAWDDPQLERSFYSRSADGGRTWSNPQAVGSSSADQVARVRVFSTPGGDFFFLGQMVGAGSCGLSQRRSTDGGQTWSGPERVFTGLTHCPADWSFSLDGNGRLWLIGIPQPGTGTLAVWDGRLWSKPVDVSLSIRDTIKGNNVSLSCLSMAVAGSSAGAAGCDTSGDIWVVRNAVELDALTPALQPVWSALATLSNRQSHAGLPALTVDTYGKLYTLWSESADGEQGSTVYAATWESNSWSRAVEVLRSPDVSTQPATSIPPTGEAEQPSAAADSQSRLHAVWNGGVGGQIFYSWTYARDVLSAQSWANPIRLPAPSAVASWPGILADPRGDVLHVTYAVPYNEGRGIYYLRSNDGGATWLTPTVVFDAATAGWDGADKPHLALDAQGSVLHAVWLRTGLPGRTGTQAVVYTRSQDGGQKWSPPVKVAEGAVDWPQVAVDGTGQVQLVWSQARTRGGSQDLNQTAEVWGQFSPDRGEHWTAPAAIGGFEQTSGPVDLTAQGTDRFYLVGVGQGIGNESTLLYAQWSGQAWGKRETFSLGQNATWGNAAIAAVPVGTGRLVVAMRSWVIEPDGVGRFEVMTTDREVVAASVVGPAPTFTPLPTFTPMPTDTPQPTATSRPRLVTSDAPPAAPNEPAPSQLPLVVGGVLAVALVLGIMVGRSVWVRRQ